MCAKTRRQSLFFKNNQVSGIVNFHFALFIYILNRIVTSPRGFSDLQERDFVA